MKLALNPQMLLFQNLYRKFFSGFSINMPLIVHIEIIGHQKTLDANISPWQNALYIAVDMVKTNILPPFHIGFMAQLHHECGSRNLIETLHAYGMCASYNELRKFQTASAEQQMSLSEEQVYIPSGILPIIAGGSLTQEGDGNIDINVETIDGKNTYHSMRRVVFQEQQLTDTPVHSTIRLKRTEHRSLECKDNSILRPLLFSKPTSHPEPVHMLNIFSITLQELNNFNICQCSKDLTWCLLRHVPRGNLLVAKDVHSSHTHCTILDWFQCNNITT